jgi:hypothetical protein
MLNEIHQQEILLAYSSQFLSKIYIDRCNPGTTDIFIELGKIEEACWNGLLKEVLPEIFAMDIYARPIYIWKIREYNSVLEIDMGEYPSDKENFFCIDPYKFLAKRLNELNN